MKKYLPLLENNVQWIALGLGGLFLLYMVYANLLTPRANVPINGETVSPGQVEAYIKEKAVTSLEAKIKDDPRQVPEELKKKPEFVKVFPDPQTVENIVVTAIPVLTVSIPDKTATPDAGLTANNAQQGVAANVQVSVLPLAKEVSNLRVEASRASVNLAPPPQVDPNNPNGAQPVAVQGADIDYVSVAFDLPMVDMSAEFRKAKIPPAFTTAFLDVQLIRQEKNEAGEWVNETIVEKLKISDQPPAPAANNRMAVSGYIAWAEANQDKVIQPKFYDVVKGDLWHLPGDEAAVAAAAAAANAGGGFAPRPATENLIRQGFDPANPPPDMTNAEKRAKYQYDVEKKRKEQAEKNRNKPQPGGGPPGGGRGGPGSGGGFPGGGGPGAFSNDSGSAPTPQPPSGVKLFQVAGPGMEGPGRMPGMMPGGMMPGQMPGMMPGDYGPGMGNPGATTTGPMPCPVGAFDPRLLNLAVTGWAHDATVQPGKTYRYKVRYSIKNPIYGAKGIANPPALAEPYQIVSKDSEWTTEVLITQRTYYYVTQAYADSAKATFEVFTYADGQLHKDTFNVLPGDMVGSNKDGVDYATGFTVVDVRSEKQGNDQVVVLADASGNLLRKSKRADSTDATKAKLAAQIAAGIAPAAGTPAGPAGMGGVGGPGIPGMPGGGPDDHMPPGAPTR